MFGALTTRLRSEIEAIRKIVALYDQIGALLYNIATPDPLAAVRGSVPNRLDFQIYNHCAALTRLYAVYAAFVDELIQEYLRALPELYGSYGELPIAILKQHRLGLSQILLKLGETGPYSHLEETEIVTTLSRGLTGERPYKLLHDAFFVDRQNYRLETVARMFGYLGIEGARKRIANEPSLRAFIAQRFGESATLLAELKRFVDLRNEAAHTHVDNVIGLEDFLAIAELIDVLCPALAQILSYEAVQRRWALGQLLVIGEVAHVYGSGLIAIVKMKPCRVAVGEEVLILRGTRVLGLATILTIQDHGRGVDEIEASMDQELGIELDRPCKRLNTIGRIGGQLRGSEELGLVPAKGSSAPQVISDSEEETEMGEEPPIGETDSDRSDD